MLAKCRTIYYKSEFMPDNIERVHEEPLFICSSIEKTNDGRKQRRSLDFGKCMKKDGKKDNKVLEKPNSYDEQAIVIDKDGIEHKACDETHPEEKRCGKIIDIEA